MKYVLHFEDHGGLELEVKPIHSLRPILVSYDEGKQKEHVYINDMFSEREWLNLTQVSDTALLPW